MLGSRILYNRALFESKKDLWKLKTSSSIVSKKLKKEISRFRSILPLIPMKESRKKNLSKNALIRTNFDKKKAAELLGISLRTLYRKLKELQLNENE